MGHVFRARHLTLDKACALKFICPEAQGSSEATARFMMEIKALGALDHPHIVTDFDAGCIDGLHYYVTELLDGHDLAGWISKRGVPPLGACSEIIRQAALGLAYAHQQRFIHRDIKPANLFLTSAGIVKVLDFGLARHAQAASDLTSTHHLLGTVDYFAPEQAENAQRCTKASDIYSLGLTFVFLLSGEAPYPTERYPTIVSKLRGHMVDRPQWLDQHGAALPPKLLRIIDTMIAKPVVDRFGHCGQIIEALGQLSQPEELSAWQQGLPIAEAARTAHRSTSRGNRLRAKPAIWLIGASSIAGSIAAATFMRPAPAVKPDNITLDRAPQPERTANTVSITNTKPPANARAMRLQPIVQSQTSTPSAGPIGSSNSRSENSSTSK